MKSSGVSMRSLAHCVALSSMHFICITNFVSASRADLPALKEVTAALQACGNGLRVMV